MTKKEKLANAEKVEVVEAPVQEVKVEAPAPKEVKVEKTPAPKEVKVEAPAPKEVKVEAPAPKKEVKVKEVKATPELSEADVKHEMIGTPTVGEKADAGDTTLEVDAAPKVTTGELARKRELPQGKVTPVKDPLAGLKQNSANGDVIGAFTV